MQGVGFRYFAEHSANALSLAGWVHQLSELAGLLWKGPRWAEVRGVDESEAPVEHVRGFSVRQ